MAGRIPPPRIDDRNGEQLAAEAIARVSGGLTVERLRREVEVFFRRIDMVEGAHPI